MGAKITGDMVKAGVVNREKGVHLLSYSLVTGPAFIIGTAGAFLGNRQAAVIVAMAHYAGALCNGLFWKNDAGGKVNKCAGISGTSTIKSENFMDNFTCSILSGFRAMAIILAYLMFFMICADMAETAGLLSFLPVESWRSFAKGMLEMTMGISAVGMCNISLDVKTILTAFLISFGGLSVIGQSLSVSGGGWLGGGQLIKIKLTHGLLAGIIAAAMIIFGNTVFGSSFML